MEQDNPTVFVITYASDGYTHIEGIYMNENSARAELDELQRHEQTYGWPGRPSLYSLDEHEVLP